MRTLRSSLRTTTATVAGGLALALVATPALPAAGASDDYTEDARAWKVVRAPSLPGVPGVLVTHDGRFVALSGSFGAYTSKDGRRWKESKGSEALFDDGTVSGAAVGERGLLVWGKQGPEDAEAITFWRSEDGKRWKRTTGSPSVFGTPGANVAVSGVAPRGSGWIAVGGDGTSGDLQGAVWTSKNGETWSRVPVTGDVFGDETHVRFPQGLAKGSEGYLAVGSERRIENGAIVEEPLAWTSENGTTWKLVTGPDAIAAPAGTPPTTRVTASSVVWDGKRYVALGGARAGERRGSFLTTSKDGRHWEQAEVDHLNPIQTLGANLPDRLALIHQIFPVPDGAAGVGFSLDREAADVIAETGAVWTSGGRNRPWSAVTGGPFSTPAANTELWVLAVKGDRALAVGRRTPRGGGSPETVVWQART